MNETIFLPDDFFIIDILYSLSYFGSPFDCGEEARATIVGINSPSLICLLDVVSVFQWLVTIRKEGKEEKKIQIDDSSYLSG